MQIIIGKKKYIILKSFSSFRDASTFARQHAKQSKTVLTIKRDFSKWNICSIDINEQGRTDIGLIKEYGIDKTPNSLISNVNSNQSNKVIDGNKPKAKITFGPYFPKRRTQEAHTISKTTPVVKKESYTGESFANRVPCYLCGGSGGSESGCLKCGGLGWVMEIDNPL